MSTIFTQTNWKTLGLLGIGNLAILAQIAYKLKKSNANISKNVKIITPKNMLFGYIAITSSLSSALVGFIQLSFFTNVANSSPTIGKYIPYTVDSNKKSKVQSLLYQRFIAFTLFAFHHSIFARHSVKKWFNDKGIISLRIERCVYMTLSNVFMINMVKKWNKESNNNDKETEEIKENDNEIIWNIKLWSKQSWWIQYAPFLVTMILGQISVNSVVSPEQMAGITDAFNINYFEQRNNISNNTPMLSTNGFYSMVRHPQMFFNIIGFLMVPKMTKSRLTLCMLFYIYVLIGIRFEEKGLIKEFGNQYIQYQKQVPQLFPTWPLFKNVKL